MSTVRLLLVEDVWPGLAVALRERGYDVIHAHDVERGGLDDAAQLSYAAQQGRAILTHNVKDYIPLASAYFLAGHSYAGVILARQMAKGRLLQRAQDFSEAISSEEMMGTVRYLGDS